MIYKPSVLRRAAAGLAMVMLAASALFAASDSPAHAKESQNIKFTSATLAHVTETGDQVPAPGRQLTVDDYFYLGVEYDATKASPKQGARSPTGCRTPSTAATSATPSATPSSRWNTAPRMVRSSRLLTAGSPRSGPEEDRLLGPRAMFHPG